MCMKCYLNRYGHIWYLNYGIRKNIKYKKKIQILQSRVLHTILAAPQYISNDTLHKDTGLLTLNEVAKLLYKRFRYACLREHPNPLIANLASKNLSENPPHRLKKNSCTGLLVWFDLICTFLFFCRRQSYFGLISTYFPLSKNKKKINKKNIFWVIFIKKIIRSLLIGVNINGIW